MTRPLTPPPFARPIFATLGALLLAGALIHAITTATFLHRAVHTQGVVADPGPGGRHAAIRLHLPSGRTIGLIAGGILTPVHTGQTVPVAYDPADPVGTATLDTAFALWFPTLLASLIGAGLLAGTARST